MTENPNTTSTEILEESDWELCPAGEISGMVKRIAQQRRLAAVGKVSAVATLLVVAGIWQFTRPDAEKTAAPDSEYQFGAICCSDVMGYAAAFQKGELNDETSNQIRQHIARCPHCGPVFKKMAGQSQATSGQNLRHRRTAALANSALLFRR